MDRKLGAVPLSGRMSWSPSNTTWPGPRPTCMPSFIFIHRTVWPQYTKFQRYRNDRQTDRTNSTDRTANGLIALWRTVFTALRSYASAVLGVVILSVCPSVRPYVTRVLCDQSEEAAGDIFIPHARAIILIF